MTAPEPVVRAMPMRRSLPWIVGGALVVLAGAVVAATPTEPQLRDEILVRGAVGDEVASRALIATLQDATFTEQVVVPDDEWSAAGNWLVVTVAASAPHTEVDAELGLATLVVGGEEFRASERIRDSITRADLRVGTDTIGQLSFELPEGLRSGAAELRLAPTISTPHLDDVLAIGLTLDALPSTQSVELVPPTIWPADAEGDAP